MIDIKLIRENKELVKENIRKKFKEEKLPIVDEVYDLDVQFRQAKKEADELRNEKNKLSDEIGSLMREGKKDEALLIKDKVSTMAKDAGAIYKVGKMALVNCKLFEMYLETFRI